MELLGVVAAVLAFYGFLWVIRQVWKEGGNHGVARAVNANTTGEQAHTVSGHNRCLVSLVRFQLFWWYWCHC